MASLGIPLHPATGRPREDRIDDSGSASVAAPNFCIGARRSALPKSAAGRKPNQALRRVEGRVSGNQIEAEDVRNRSDCFRFRICTARSKAEGEQPRINRSATSVEGKPSRSRRPRMTASVLATYPICSRQARHPAGLLAAGMGAASMARQCRIPFH